MLNFGFGRDCKCNFAEKTNCKICVFRVDSNFWLAFLFHCLKFSMMNEKCVAGFSVCNVHYNASANKLRSSAVKSLLCIISAG